MPPQPRTFTRVSLPTVVLINRSSSDAFIFLRGADLCGKECGDLLVRGILFEDEFKLGRDDL